MRRQCSLNRLAVAVTVPAPTVIPFAVVLDELFKDCPLILYLGRPSLEDCHATETFWKVLPYRV
jgi:hypothetical protein